MTIQFQVDFIFVHYLKWEWEYKVFYLDSCTKIGGIIRAFSCGGHSLNACNARLPAKSKGFKIGIGSFMIFEYCFYSLRISFKDSIFKRHLGSATITHNWAFFLNYQMNINIFFLILHSDVVFGMKRTISHWIRFCHKSKPDLGETPCLIMLAYECE